MGKGRAVHRRHSDPKRQYSNIGKQIMGEKIYDMFRLAHEMAGGIVVTAPTPEDAANPAVKSRVDHYLQGKADALTAERLKLARFLEDVTASYQGGWYSIISLHGSGSPAAETIEILRRYPVDERRALVRAWRGWRVGEAVLYRLEVASKSRPPIRRHVADCGPFRSSSYSKLMERTRGSVSHPNAKVTPNSRFSNFTNKLSALRDNSLS